MFHSLNWLDDEDGQFEKTCTKGLLSPEEIEQLRFDESLTELDKALQIFSDGQESQKISLANNLPNILLHEPASFSQLLPQFVEMTNSASDELLTICGQCITNLILSGLLSSQQMSSHISPLIWSHINNKDSYVHQTWLIALTTLILESNKDTLTKSDIVKLALAKGNLAQKTSSRIACSKLISTLCSRLDPPQIENDIFPSIRMLCQDIDYEVRSAMCNNLVHIAQSIGELLTVKLLIPEIRELLEDEELQVRNSAVTVMLDISAILSIDVLKQMIAPLVWPYFDIGICEKPSFTTVTISRVIGKLGLNLSGIMDDNRKEWYVKYFIKLCKASSVISNGALDNKYSSEMTNDITLESIDTKETDINDSISYLCAYNLPAIVYNIGRRLTLESGLLDTISVVSSHPHYSVRRVVAAGIHEIIRILGNESVGLVSVYKSLLEDNHVTVQAALIGNMVSCLKSFAPSFPKGQAPPVGLPDLIPSLLQHEAVVGTTRDWRAYTTLIEAWSEFPTFFTADQIHSSFTPRLIKLALNNTVLPVKKAVLIAVVRYIHVSRYATHRHELTVQITKGLSRNKKFNQRLMYVEFCLMILEKFSKKFFKEYCFTPALLLINDSTPIVRVKSSSLLPYLKSQLKMPSDRPLLQQLEASSRRSLMSERNKEVLSYIQQAVIELDKKDVKLDSEPDPEDKRREEEQNQFIMKEDRSDHIKAMGRTSLPELSALDISKKGVGRKMSLSTFSEASDRSENTTPSSRSKRKMSQAVVSITSRRASSHSGSASRRASMPPSAIVDVANKTRKANSVKLKTGNK